MTGWQLVISGLLLSFGSLLSVVLRHKDNPKFDEPIAFLPFDYLIKLSLTVSLGLTMFIIGTLLVVTPHP